MARLTNTLFTFLVAGMPLLAQEFTARDILVVQRPPQGSRLAVVVGVGDYEQAGLLPPLQYANKDARDLAKLLEKQGFAVQLMLMDPAPGSRKPYNAAAILDEVERMCGKADSNDTILFFFSGHGFANDKQVSFLCPYNCSVDKLEESALSLEQVAATMGSCKAKKAVLIADACRNIPGAKSGIVDPKVRNFELARGIGTLFSTEPGFRSFEPQGGMQDRDGNRIENGVFTHFLLRGLRGEADGIYQDNKDGYVTFRETAFWVGKQLKELQGVQQKPFMRWDGGADDDIWLTTASQEGGATPATSSNPDGVPPGQPAPGRTGRKPTPRNRRPTTPTSDEGQVAADAAEVAPPAIALAPLPDLIRDAGDSLAAFDKSLGAVRDQLMRAVAVSEVAKEKRVDERERRIALAKSVQSTLNRQPAIHEVFDAMQAKVRLLNRVPLPGYERPDGVVADDAFLAAVVKGRKQGELKAFFGRLSEIYKDVDPSFGATVLNIETNRKMAPVDLDVLREVLGHVASRRDNVVQFAEGREVSEIVEVSRNVVGGDAASSDAEPGPLDWGQNTIRWIYDSSEYSKELERLRPTRNRNVRFGQNDQREKETDQLVIRARKFRATLQALEAWVEFATVAVGHLEVAAVPEPGEALADFVYDTHSRVGSKDERLPWALVLRRNPDPTWIPDADIRRRIQETGLPWCVRDRTSGIAMLLVPPGAFAVGGKGEPLRQIRKPFYLGATEVTREQWLRVMGGAELPAGSGLLPATEVSWDATKTFLERAGLILPSEAQWEYACRAGTSTLFAFGDELAAEAGIVKRPDDHNQAPQRVGLRLRNAFGFTDMHGNVAEWCADVFTTLSPSGDEAPALGSGSRAMRVMRGGSAYDEPAKCTSFERGVKLPDLGLRDCGFRVARSVP